MNPTTRGRARRIARIVGAISALLVLAGCSNVGPQDFLNPEGPVARDQHNLIVPVFIIAGVIFLLVEGLIIFAAFRFRATRNAKDPVQVHGNTKMELGWTIAPAVLMAAIAVPTVATIFSLAEVPKPGPNVVQVKVIGHQWWWEYEYKTNPVVKTANELVIPVGSKISMEITSVDVIHSFWVPKLGGKQDAIPNRITPLVLVAEKPGVYFGQCAEFCALSHANMKLRVRALPAAEYKQWLAGQQADATIPSSGLAGKGAEAFKSFKEGTCIACHTLRGLEGAGGTVGPDLTHFASRESFAGSILEMNAKDLRLWLLNPPDVKPGSLMPNYHIPQDTIDALVAFLLSLK